jgi:hypothetical protein
MGSLERMKIRIETRVRREEKRREEVSVQAVQDERWGRGVGYGKQSRISYGQLPCHAKPMLCLAWTVHARSGVSVERWLDNSVCLYPEASITLTP